MNDVIDYEAHRYEGWGLNQLIEMLSGGALALLQRGTRTSLIARRELGGILVAICHKLTSYAAQASLFRRLLNLGYPEGRRHMKLWLYWDKIDKILRDREESCRQRNVPFVTPGYRRCLEMAGIDVRGKAPHDPPPPPLGPDPLPDDTEALLEMVEELQQQNRLERAEKARLLVELDITRDEVRELAAHREPDEQTNGIIGKVTGWWKRRHRALPAPASDRPSEIEVRQGDCLDLIEQEENVYDAVVTDAPYAISLHGKEWDSTDISFSPALWERFRRVVKPGGYVAFFAAPRLYHRAAEAAEKAGFKILPFLGWRFRDGLPKPINVSELFDRENLDEREIIGVRRGSGFTQANVDQGAQNRTHTVFAAQARHVSEEAQQWRGWYYGVNALKPSLEPILLAQKPILGRMIENLRQWGTGALNIGALRDQYGFWPSTMLSHRKTNKSEHLTNHPSVKPVTLMEDLCTLVCPRGGRILDPFAGTGPTGIAAKRCGFDCVLIEQDAGMCQVIEERLRRET